MLLSSLGLQLVSFGFPGLRLQSFGGPGGYGARGLWVHACILPFTCYTYIHDVLICIHAARMAGPQKNRREL